MMFDKFKNMFYPHHQTTFKNKLNITNREELEEKEAEIIATRAMLLEYDDIIQAMPFNKDRLIAVNDYLLCDLYDFAGSIREVDYYDLHYLEDYGDLMDFSNINNIDTDFTNVMTNFESNWNYYSDEERLTLFGACMTDLWMLHPFYRANSASCLIFSADFAKEHLDINIDQVKLLKKYDLDELFFKMAKGHPTELLEALVECNINRKENTHFYDLFPDKSACDENKKTINQLEKEELEDDELEL